MKHLTLMTVFFLSFQVNADYLFSQYPSGELKFGTYLCNVNGNYQTSTDFNKIYSGEQKYHNEKINFTATITIKGPIEYPVIILEWIDDKKLEKMQKIFLPFGDKTTNLKIIGIDYFEQTIIILQNEYDTFTTILAWKNGEEIMRGKCK